MIVIKNEKDHEQDVHALQKMLSQHSNTLIARDSKNSNALHDKAYRKKCSKLEVSKLKSICWIDCDKLEASVEPGVSMYSLCKETLKSGLIPCVVPEFKTITVGGAIMGAAIESSSHIYGQFSDTCIQYELLLGDGNRIRATREQHSDLFFALPGSYGTLAILTAATIKLKKAKTHVRMRIVNFEDKNQLADFLIHEGVSDYIEGVILNEKSAVAIVGNLSEYDSRCPEFKQKTKSAKWFYQHLTEIAHHKLYTEQMPLLDYLFRYDLGAFWMGRFLLSTPLLMQALLNINLASIAKKIAKSEVKPYPPRFFRSLFGRVFQSGFLYRLFHKVPKAVMEKLFFIHDFYVPKKVFKEALKEFVSESQLYPVWLCPVKGGGEEQFLSPNFGNENFINIGLYGHVQHVIELTKKLEKRVVELGGRKMLYSFSYYPEDEFSTIYDAKSYKSLREKYGAKNRFPSLFEKVCSWQRD